MTDREKLIEILQFGMDKYFLLKFEAEIFAELLIANGVTFATDTNDGCKWISVEERLPEKEFEEFTEQMDWDVYPCLCVAKNHVSGIRYVAKLFYDGSNFVDDEFVRYTSSVTHWMPLPEPPKED